MPVCFLLKLTDPPVEPERVEWQTNKQEAEAQQQPTYLGSNEQQQ